MTRVVGYIRVSKEGGRGKDLVSPQIQQTAIENHCKAQGYDLLDIVTDIDKSGRLWKNRQIEDQVARIESGSLDGIVVWKLSRLARDRKDMNVAIDRIESVGGIIESATEPNDRTSSGRFARGVLSEMAAFESERMSDTWREVHEQRSKAGLPHYGPQRLGYSYIPRQGTNKDLADRGVYIIDDEQVEIVRELYARYLKGEGLSTLTTWLRAEGVVGARGKPWSRFGVAYYLRSGFAAGLLHVHNPDGHKDPQNRLCRNSRGSCSNRIHVQGSHPAIITEQTWHQPQAEQQRRRVAPVRSRVPVSKLAGVVICTGCGRPMQLQASSGKPRWAYVCRSKRLTVDGCSNPGWVRRDVCESVAEDWLRSGAADEVEKLTQMSSPAVTLARRTRLTRRLLEIDAETARLLRLAVSLEMPEDAVRVVRAELIAEQKAAQTELDRLPEEDRPAVILNQVRGVLAVWRSAEPHEIASLVRDLFRIEVTMPGKVTVVPAWLVQEPSLW